MSVLTIRIKNYCISHLIVGHHHHQSMCSESNVESGVGGMLSNAGSTYFGEEITAHSLLTPSGPGAPAVDSTSPSLLAKSLLGKLALRKPSILSITSNLSSPGASGGEGKGGQLGGSIENMEKGITLAYGMKPFVISSTQTASK